MNRKTFIQRAALVPLVASIPAPAFAEGATVEPLRLPAVRPQGFGVQHIGFKTAIQGFEHVYPILARALQDQQQANSTTIEWRADGRREFNYTQIVRHPFGVSNTEHSRHGDAFLRKLRLEQLHQHLKAVDDTLRTGTRHEDVGKAYWIKRCGGTMSYRQVGRNTPEIRLFTLRDLCLIANRQAPDYDGYKEEWLSEFSLELQGQVYRENTWSRFRDRA